MEAEAKHDPIIIICANNLATVIPDVAIPLLESHTHISVDKMGTRSGHIRQGRFVVNSQKLPDGSLIQSTDSALKSIARIMQKNGFDEAPIYQAQRLIESGPEDTAIHISPELKIIKWKIKDVKPDLSAGSTMNPLIPVKIAYEFLACHLGTAVYSENPALYEIRKSLQEMSLPPKAISVERLLAKDIKPFHGICFEGNSPHARVQIRLFGYLAFRVHFLHLAIPGPRFIYSHPLDSHKEAIGIVDEAP